MAGSGMAIPLDVFTPTIDDGRIPSDDDLLLLQAPCALEEDT